MSPVRSRRGPRPGVRRRRLLGFAAAAGLALGACSGEEPPPAAEAVVDTPWVPLRNLVVSFGPARGPDGKPGKGPAIRTREEASARAADLRAKIVAPGGAFGSFADVASKESDDPVSRADGGFVGFWHRAMKIDPKIMDVVEALKDGEVSEPLPYRDAIYLFQRLSREEGKRVEAETTAIVVGFIAPWAAVHRFLPPERTKDVVYRESLDVLEKIRHGTLTPDESAVLIPGAERRSIVLHRHGAKKGFEAMVDAAFALTPGETTDPVETPEGWAVLERRPYYRAKVKQILILHRASRGFETLPERSPEDAVNRAREVLSLARADPTRWPRLVREYSDHVRSHAIEGSIGDVSDAAPADVSVVGQIADVVAELKPGEFSEPISTVMGVHVLWRVD